MGVPYKTYGGEKLHSEPAAKNAPIIKRRCRPMASGIYTGTAGMILIRKIKASNRKTYA
jgi:hypothetical protein